MFELGGLTQQVWIWEVNWQISSNVSMSVPWHI